MFLQARRDGYSIRRGLPLVVALALILLIALVAWRFCRPQGPTPPHPYPSLSEIAGVNPLADEEFQSGKYYPLPESGEPLPGRPSEPMPIPRMIYSSVELTLDGRPVESEPVRLRGGTTVHVKGVVTGRPELPDGIIMGAGLGLTRRADNERGWIVQSDHYFGSRTSQNMTDADAPTTVFEGEYPVPDAPGEYVLVVLSDAHTMGEPLIPILIAAEFDAVIE